MKSSGMDLAAGKGCCVCGCWHGPKCRRCNCVGVVLMPFVLLAVLVIWVSFFWKLTEEVDTLLCGFTTIATDLKYGVNVVGNSQFSGLKGYSYFMKETKSGLSATRSTTHANSIVTEAAKNQATSYSTSLGDYYTNFGSSTVTSPLDGTTTIQPDLASDMTATINSAIATEKTSILEIATNQTDAATLVAALSNSYPAAWTIFSDGAGNFFFF